MLHFKSLLISLALNKFLDLLELVNIHKNSFIVEPVLVKADGLCMADPFFLNLLHFHLQFLGFRF